MRLYTMGLESHVMHNLPFWGQTPDMVIKEIQKRSSLSDMLES